MGIPPSLVISGSSGQIVLFHDHFVGSAREAVLQQEIQEGQKLRLRSVQDDLLMCLRKQEDIDQTINKLNEVSSRDHHVSYIYIYIYKKM